MKYLFVTYVIFFITTILNGQQDSSKLYHNFTDSLAFTSPADWNTPIPIVYKKTLGFTDECGVIAWPIKDPKLKEQIIMALSFLNVGFVQEGFWRPEYVIATAGQLPSDNNSSPQSIIVIVDLFPSGFTDQRYMYVLNYKDRQIKSIYQASADTNGWMWASVKTEFTNNHYDTFEIQFEYGFHNDSHELRDTTIGYIDENGFIEIVK